ncbi:STAS domain-containing protein [Actinocrispum sp. NPDC049592]|uniref:STAS domain-containing protein n=1 Tax=Actinocrispum sp. NPDC049592 TaxID=3154835 RepID=UPI003415E843
MSSAEFQPLSVNVEQGPSGRVLNAAGEIDTLTAPELRSRVEQSLPAAGEVLVIDLSGVTFLSSAGLSVLAWAHQEADTAGGTVRIVTSAGTARVFELTGLAETLNLFGSLTEARG